MKEIPFLSSAPPDFIWPQCPEADRFVRDRVEAFCRRDAFAGGLAEEMRARTSTCFFDWVDHLILADESVDRAELKSIGYRSREASAGSETRLWVHPHAQLPSLCLEPEAQEDRVAIGVEQIEDFATAHELTPRIQGGRRSTCRLADLGDRSTLRLIERRGGDGLEPDPRDRWDLYEGQLRLWLDFKAGCVGQADPEAAMTAAEAEADRMIEALGVHAAAACFLEAERRYWQSRNDAAQLQKKRQDALGLGWANHDHHTFRSSRLLFSRLVRLLGAFGFERRERFYAGAEAGWGAQVMEQPTAGYVIFADVDLKPQEVALDFATTPLEPSDKLGTVGLWCALHGDSILEAGMHHLEAQFDFEKLRDDLAAEGIETMAPFSDFEYLKQAFTTAERWDVRPDRLKRLLDEGKIGPEAAERIGSDGAVGSHLENLQRRNGYKGFNQSAVNRIIQQVNPERQALH
ncbi:MAG: hypothetical protein R3236_02965 [Phycisphaeraceae bacterium]|nr:hypothetical protein [Phycisphaeraceae bacterium]